MNLAIHPLTIAKTKDFSLNIYEWLHNKCKWLKFESVYWCTVLRVVHVVECETNEWIQSSSVMLQKRMRNKKGDKSTTFTWFFPLCINLIVAFWLQWFLAHPFSFTSSSNTYCHTSSMHEYSISIHDASMEASNSYMSVKEREQKTYLPLEKKKKEKQFSNWHINYVYSADAPIFIECDQI